MDMPNQGQAAAGPSTSYDLQEELGNGTFGDVYRAVCLRTGKALAIKLVNKAFLRDINAQRRLLKEIQIQRKLTHPNIVALHDCYEDRHHVFLVMDLCSKGELLSLVRRCGRLPEMKVVGLFRQLVEGVTYLHSKSIMHRDIKLANILLDGDGEDIRLKIADFGLAAALDSSDSERTTVCGTPNYLSPEIAFNQPYTYASDLWSLGVALYTMLVGTPPFQGSQVSETIQRVKQGAYSLPDHLTEDARDLINNLLQKDPKMRVPLLEILKHPFLAKCKALPPKPELGPCVSEPSSSVTMKLPSDQPNHTEGQQPRDEPARRQPLDRLVMPPPPPRPREPRQLHASGNSSGKENQPDAVTHHKHGSVGETSKRSKVLGESNGLQRDTWLSHCPSPHPVPQRAKLNPVLPLPTTSSPGWSSEYPSTQQMTSKSAITFGPPEASMSPVRPDVASMGTRPPSQLASSEELQQCATELCRSSLAAAVPTSSSQQRSDPQPSTRQATPYMPSTRRLAPQRHSTSYGHLAILPGGLVEVQHSASGVNITVASDGARLRLQRPGRPDKEYATNHMPQGLRPFYNVAAGFVSLVASATPRVVHDSPEARAVLSEAGDVTVTLKGSTQSSPMHLEVFSVRFQPGATQVEIVLKGRMEPLVLDLALLESSLDDTGLPGIPAGLPAPALRRALATALRVSEQCTKAEARAASEAGAVYPIVTRTRVATPRPSQG